jgi:hypothetical protein
MWIYSSGMAGGGVPGKVAGTARIITTGVGLITMLFHFFILMWIRVGEDTTESVAGMDTRGTMTGYLTGDFNRTGRAGAMIDIGKDKGPGASRAINPGRNNSCRI